MKTPQSKVAPSYGLGYWVSLVLQTRRFGHTYVHTGARQNAPASYRAFRHENILFSYSGWGRSLNTGGHKYKVHARYSDTGKPVPAKALKSL